MPGRKISWGFAESWVPLLALGVALAGGASACKGSSSEPPASASAAPDPKALESSEDDLLARRDSLLSARARLRKKRQELGEQLRAVREQGGDTHELDERAARLDAEERQLSEQEEQLNHSLDAYLKERRALLEQLTTQASAQSRAAVAQTLMTSREKDLAAREKDLAAREAKLAEREAVLARREKETCGVASTTVIQSAPPPGASYGKADVEPMLKRARLEMSRKGILRSDLPAGVQDLENEATQAMARGDYGRAHFAANQLVRSVRGLRIDKAFITAKFARLNALIKGKTLTSKVDRRISALFREATASFGDGKFASANRSLNKIYSTID